MVLLRRYCSMAGTKAQVWQSEDWPQSTERRPAGGSTVSRLPCGAFTAIPPRSCAQANALNPRIPREAGGMVPCGKPPGSCARANVLNPVNSANAEQQCCRVSFREADCALQIIVNHIDLDLTKNECSGIMVPNRWSNCAVRRRDAVSGAHPCPVLMDPVPQLRPSWYWFERRKEAKHGQGTV